jgi:hypothetical protein
MDEVLGAIVWLLVLAIALGLVIGVPAVMTFKLARLAYWKRGGAAGVAVAVMMCAGWWNEPGVTFVVSLPVLGCAWLRSRRRVYELPLPELPRAEVV